MKVLVTGGTGFLGCHVMDELCRRVDGARIRVLSLFDTPALRAHGVEVLLGTVTSPSDVARAMDGVSHVYHLAGFVSRRPEDAHLMFDVHVNGTRVVCQAAAAAGVPRILMSSTPGTIAISEREDEWPDESSPPPLPLTAAAAGIDACPMEGFDPRILDEELGLPARGLASVALVALGYRGAGDWNARLPKSRLPRDAVLTII